MLKGMTYFVKTKVLLYQMMPIPDINKQLLYHDL